MQIIGIDLYEGDIYHQLSLGQYVLVDGDRFLVKGLYHWANQSVIDVILDQYISDALIGMEVSLLHMPSKK